MHRLFATLAAACGQEALRIVELMNNMPDRWRPANNAEGSESAVQPAGEIQMEYN